jgi:hypothetical protein
MTENFSFGNRKVDPVLIMLAVLRTQYMKPRNFNLLNTKMSDNVNLVF